VSDNGVLPPEPAGDIYYYYYYYYLIAIVLTHGGSSVHLHTNSPKITDDGTYKTITKRKFAGKLGSAGVPHLRVIHDTRICTVFLF
jgi:hypothetical protein